MLEKSEPMSCVRRFVCMFAVGALLFCCFPAASQADTVSGWSGCKVDGIAYKYNSKVVESDGGLSAVGVVKTASGNGVAAKKMGVQARLFSSSNVLVSVSSVVYNAKGDAKVKAKTSARNNDGKGYYANSRVYLKNGSSYDVVNAGASPVQKASSETSSVCLSTSFEGRTVTYGSGLQPNPGGGQPDLICAEGVGGEIGYVKSVDLERDGDSPYEIPVYDLDGNTVDTFIVGEER